MYNVQLVVISMYVITPFFKWTQPKNAQSDCVFK